MILFLCYVFPPLAVLFMGRPFSAFLNCFLTCFGWVPGIRHALVCYADRRVTKTVKQVTGAINRPAWARDFDERSEGRVRRRGQNGPLHVEYIDLPDVGRNGTQFRHKQSGFTLFEVMFGIAAVVGVVLFILAIIVAVHFIGKYW